MDNLNEENAEFSDESEDDSGLENDSIEYPKRKSKEINSKIPMKKVKYENIQDSTRKKPKNDLYKPPTVEELNQLKETENLYNNNLFRLQIEEILKETQIKNKHKSWFDSWFKSFESIIEKLPEFRNISTSEVKFKPKISKKKNVVNNFINNLAKNCNEMLKSDQNLILQFIKPDKVEHFGLYKIGALPGPILNASINLTMPKNCFNTKDYLNNRYLLKRQYYLLYIAEFLDKNIKKSFIYHEENKLLPILQIIPDHSDKICINIYASPPEDYFKPSRFLPNKNNIKSNIFHDSLKLKNEQLLSCNSTILYNSTLLFDVTLNLNNDFIQQSLQDLSNVQEGLRLIYIWLTQRELNNGQTSFTASIAVYLIVYLILRKKINKHMSSYQVVRNFWSFINESDLSNDPISLCESNGDYYEFKTVFDVVLIDRSGCYNVAAFLNLDTYQKVRNECKLALKLLDNGGLGSFHSLFIRKLPFELQYDLILSVKSCSKFKEILEHVSDEDKIAYASQEQLLAIKYITNNLKKGLNKRYLYIVPKFMDNFDRILFGINLNPSTAFHFIEIGPALNDPKEKEFRDFWGRLSSDRRFKDGSVCIAVYFETNTIKEKRGIIKTIINFVIAEKLNLEYDLYYDEFEDLLINKKIEAPFKFGTNEECCLKIISSADDLGRKIRALEMPLAITGIQGISNSFSFTEVFPPFPMNYKCDSVITTLSGKHEIFKERLNQIGAIPKYVQPIECVLHLEHSSKWPKDLQALRHMKTAFYLEISKLLKLKHKIISGVRPENFDILYEGFVFRYTLYLSREIGLLKKESTDDGTVVYKNSPESIEMEKKMEILPKITGALKGIQSQHPSYGPSTCLIKRWLCSHLIDDFHFPDIVINLLNVSLYLNCSPFILPSTPQIAFLRFLKFFSELQYDLQPVVVNFNEELSKDDINAIDSKLLENRQNYPELFIVMPYDNYESLFTKTAPSREILNRVKQLAVGTLNIYQNVVIKQQLINIKNLFIPNLEGYNLLIYLNPALNPRKHEEIIANNNEKITLDTYNSKNCWNIPIVGFNPVQLYLRDLRTNYGEFASFFHDTYGGNIIGVLWSPKSLEEKDFKVSQIHGRKLVDGKLILNVDSIIEDFYILGKNLVKTIVKKS